MLIWGSGHKTIERGVEGLFLCARCGHSSIFSVVVDYDYSHLYWIFKFVKNVRTLLVCQNCRQAQEADDQKAVFEKLGGNPIPITDRFGGVVLVLLVLGFGVFAVLSQASRDSTGAIDRAGKIDAFAIRSGDCFNDKRSASVNASEVSSLAAVPCEEPHDNEIYALFNLEVAAFPENEAIAEIVNEECLIRFAPYVGRDYESSSLEIAAMQPTLQAWNEPGDREVACILFDMNLRKLQGSMKGSGR